MAEKSYHFSVCNSPVGPVGFCARITAPSREVAVERLRAYLDTFDQTSGVAPYDDVVDDGPAPSPGVEYLRIYFGAAHVGPDDIDEVNETDENGNTGVLAHDQS